MEHGNSHGAFHGHGATPTGWFLLEKIPLKWMMTGGTPIFRKPTHRTFYFYFFVGCVSRWQIWLIARYDSIHNVILQDVAS